MVDLRKAARHKWLCIGAPQSVKSTPVEEAVTSTTMEPPEEASPMDETTPTMTSETLSEANTPLVHAHPRFPTVAKKCPRKEFHNAKPVAEEAETPLPPPKTLTALQEIWKLQCIYQDILPFASFSRLVQELSHDLVEMRFTKEAIQAFRSGAEAYLLEFFEKANLACMHVGRCTLQAKDIRVV